MIGGLESVYVREIRLWRRFEVMSSIETWEGTQVIGRHRFVLDNGETAALIMTTGGVYDRPAAALSTSTRSWRHLAVPFSRGRRQRPSGLS